ncbi:MAG: PAS domain S-box protein [Deltaproteobacteria bacterium]|nr:PAS domain S-box protein [Deltaproteobacteria bacterium]
MSYKLKLLLLIIPLVIVPILIAASVFVLKLRGTVEGLQMELMAAKLESLRENCERAQEILKTSGYAQVAFYVNKSKLDILILAEETEIPGGEVFILESQGKVVSHKAPNLDADSIRQITERKNGRVISERNSEKLLTVFTYFSEWDWILAATAKEKVFLKPLHDSRRLTLLTAGITGLFALLVLYFLITGVSRPVRDLEKASQEISRGNLNTRLEIQTNDEFGKLAEAFNLMSADLRKSMDSLKAEIREREETEKALGESEAKYRELVQNANSIILRMDVQGRVTFFNEFAQRFFGYTEQEILGRNVVGAIVPETETTGRDLAQMIRDIGVDPERYETNENENIRKNGERVWVAWTNRAIRDEQGNIVEILCIGNDMSERKRLEAELRQSQKMEAIGTLAGGIAHDFNNILAAIIGYTELASLDLEDRDKAGHHLVQVHKATNRAKDLVKQILTFSRQTDQERRPTDIGLIVKEALKLLRATLPTTIDIRQEIEAQSGPVEADPTQIQQVVMNLCANAAHAMSDGGGILEVRLAKVVLERDFTALHPPLKPGHHLKLTVADTGMGMTEDLIHRIFEPYFTTKETGQGTGLGLAVVHGIVAGHGGAITVESRPGKGSSFHVFFPLLQIDFLPEAMEDRDLPTGREHILFVDDERLLVDIGKQVLERLGYRVTATASSLEALNFFRESPDRFDLVITDMTMPQMTGDRLAVELMRIRPEIPIILCTGFSHLVSDEKVKRAGIREFVMKPIVIRDLANTVRKVLDGK